MKKNTFFRDHIFKRGFLFSLVAGLLLMYGFSDGYAANYFPSLTGAPESSANSDLPVITDAEYDALTGQLTLNGNNFNVDNEVVAEKLTISNGTNSYRLTGITNNVYPSSSSRAVLLIQDKEKAFFNWIFNNNGISSRDNNQFTLSVSAQWNGMSLPAKGTEPVVVTNFAPPAIESATYNRDNGEFIVTATRLAASTSSVKDIDVSRLTITGRDNLSWTLTSSTADQDVTSETVFEIYISGNDKVEVDKLIDEGGTMSGTDHSYNLRAANRWNRPVHTDYNIAGLSESPVTVLNTTDQLEITVTPDPGQSKVYGEPDPVFTYTYDPPLEEGDEITGSLGRDPGEDAGLYDFTLGDLSAGEDYELVLDPASPRFEILPLETLPLEVTVTPDPGQSKVYGEPDPVFTYTYDPPLEEGDEITGSLGRTSGEDTGLYDFTLGDLSAGEDYELVLDPASPQFEILPLTVFITGSFTAYDKLYDGTVDAEIEDYNLSLDGILTGDNVNLAGTVVNFAGPGPGSDIEVFIFDAQIQGGDAPNYSLSLTGAPKSSANIKLSPGITDAEYDALTGQLTLNGNNFNVGNEVVAEKLTISNGTNSYNLTGMTDNVYPSSSSRAVLHIQGKEKAFFNWIFNNNGIRSRDNNQYTISAAADWNGMAFPAEGAEPVVVMNFVPPAIESATYNRDNGEFIVTATRLAASTSSVKDIDVSRLTITGKDNLSWTLTSSTADQDVTSETIFRIYISGNDKVEVDKLIDVGGTISSTGHPYNLGAANRWNRPVHTGYNIADLTGNPVTAINIPNQPPVASNVTVTGNPDIGETVTGYYEYDDYENDPEGNSLFAWYRAADAEGNGEELITGEDELTYTIRSEDAGKFIAFEVTPVAQSGATPGDPVKSDYVEVSNAPPTASDVVILGTLAVSVELQADYAYYDAENDPEGETIIKWFRSDDTNGTNEQEIDEGQTYTLTLDDEGKYIRISVTPVATSGTLTGETVYSGYYGPVINTLPTASVTGINEFCQGTSVDLLFSFTGSAPWEVLYTDGTEEYSFTSVESTYTVTVYESGNYRVTRLVDGEGFEGAELGEDVRLESIPVITIDNYRYIENFDGGAGEWKSFPDPSGADDIWKFGLPDGTVFTSASSGSNIWYTDLSDKFVPLQTWVAGPCFDFGEAVRPMIAIDLFRKFGNGSDGAVLQYTTNNGQIWQNAGEPGQGIKWYNSSFISGMPGGQEAGWTGQEEEWTESRHDLDDIAGENFVRFRISYGSDGSGSSEGGFAFDNIRIGERNKLVLMEHFTNARDNSSIAANDILRTFAGSRPYDMAYISFHTSFPEDDPLNAINPADPLTRALYYGVSSVPLSVMDGGTDGGLVYDYTSSVPDVNDLLASSLKDPAFSISIDQYNIDNEIFVDLNLRSLVSQNNSNLLLHVAIIEKEIDGSLAGLSDELVFRNVVKKLVPDAGGTPLPASWNPGQITSYSFSWEAVNIFHEDNLAIVAFIQDDNTRSVLQTAVSSEFEFPVTEDPPSPVIPFPPVLPPTENVVFYPNPSVDEVYIRFPRVTDSRHILEVYDISGKMITSEFIYEGRYLHPFSAGSLRRGMYIFRVVDSNGNSIAKELIIRQ